MLSKDSANNMLFKPEANSKNVSLSLSLSVSVSVCLCVSVSVSVSFSLFLFPLLSSGSLSITTVQPFLETYLLFMRESRFFFFFFFLMKDAAAAELLHWPVFLC